MSLSVGARWGTLGTSLTGDFFSKDSLRAPEREHLTLREFC